jgi:hypothetical protein
VTKTLKIDKEKMDEKKELLLLLRCEGSTTTFFFSVIALYLATWASSVPTLHDTFCKESSVWCVVLMSYSLTMHASQVESNVTTTRLPVFTPPKKSLGCLCLLVHQVLFTQLVWDSRFS